jgi:glutathionylspermidine synthase
MSARSSTKPILEHDPRVEHWDAMREVSPALFSDVRCRMILEGCKWDPQVGDVATLASFPLVIPADVFRTLGQLAERLTVEALDAERILLERPECQRMLGMPRAVRRALAIPAKPTPAAARVIRYDFHPTSEGWRITEANADVPGGYTESSLFPRLMAEHCPGTRPAGDPAAALTDAIVATMGSPGSVGLLAATGHMEDQQVIAFLAGLLRARGCSAVRAHPRQVIWDDGVALLARPARGRRRLDALVRFYQGEWLKRWSGRDGFAEFFRGGRTPVCNPGTALMIESKRFPLVWDRLGLNLPTWRTLLPTTCDPGRLNGRFGPGWVLKTAFCNTGDTVAIADGPDRGRWNRAVWGACLRPGRWVAQRRFETLPIPTPRGPMYPCLGVYTVDGRAAGLFGRMASRPLIDLAAVEVAVLRDADKSG